MYYAESLAHIIARVNPLFALPHAPRVFLGGFSQGCGLALALAYSNMERLHGALAGALCFSGYVVDQPIQKAAVLATPLLWAHHAGDTDVSIQHPS